MKTGERKNDLDTVQCLARTKLIDLGILLVKCVPAIDRQPIVRLDPRIELDHKILSEVRALLEFLGYSQPIPAAGNARDSEMSLIIGSRTLAKQGGSQHCPRVNQFLLLAFALGRLW